jgi:Mn2+/Fe2+ NRAMP family transporter
VALIGGVGGTVTILCYGYWIREEGRQGIEQLAVCRVDLAVGYAMTALFGLAMVVIGSRVEVEGGGAGLIVNLAEQLKAALHPAAKWAFLAGAWGAVFSSLLGVWQSIPYLFANCWKLLAEPGAAPASSRVDTRSAAYRGYLLISASVPAAGLWMTFESAQKLYAVVGATFVPMLAAVLLFLNGRSDLVGRKNRNSRLMSLLLICSLAFFALAAWFEIRKRFST